MRQRGRKTPDTLAGLAAESGDPKPAHLDPPDCLDKRGVAEWHAIVARFGPSAFPHETHALLVSMCGAIVTLNDVSLEIAALEPGIPIDRSGWNKFRHLIRLRGQLATQVAMLGTKLRILPQSRDVRRSKTADFEQLQEAGEIKPWHDVN